MIVHFHDLMDDSARPEDRRACICKIHLSQGSARYIVEKLLDQLNPDLQQPSSYAISLKGYIWQEPLRIDYAEAFKRIIEADGNGD